MQPEVDSRVDATTLALVIASISLCISIIMMVLTVLYVRETNRIANASITQAQATGRLAETAHQELLVVLTREESAPRRAFQLSEAELRSNAGLVYNYIADMSRVAIAPLRADSQIVLHQFIHQLPDAVRRVVQEGLNAVLEFNGFVQKARDVGGASTLYVHVGRQVSGFEERVDQIASAIQNAADTLRQHLNDMSVGGRQG